MKLKNIEIPVDRISVRCQQWGTPKFAMRSKVVHDYLNADEDVVWDTVENELAPLVVRLMIAIVRFRFP